MARWFAWLGPGLVALSAVTLSSAQGLQPGDDPEASPIWRKVHATLLEGRAINPVSDELLTLQIPARAIDGAMVPVAIHTRVPAGAGYYVSKLFLIIDANPSPIAAIFQFTPDSGRADIETRVRVDAYSHVRALAQTSDGRLFMVTRFVKASGGCSAPAASDAAAALAQLGQMRFRVDDGVRGTQAVKAQLLITHPNHSGLAMDQISRQYTPAHYVRQIDISYAGRTVLKADVDFSISENPTLSFYFLPRDGGELRASVTDSQDMHFVATQVLP